jgi:hypothetical protein
MFTFKKENYVFQKESYQNARARRLYLRRKPPLGALARQTRRLGI